MPDLLDLERWCKGLPDQIDRAANVLATEVTVAMAENLIANTPIDITTAVSNWQVSLNAPAMFDLPAIYPGDHGSTGSASRRAALQHVVTTLKDKDPGMPVYLSNLTPYINDLNAGTSPQARPGWIDRGVRIGELYGDTAVLRIEK